MPRLSTSATFCLLTLLFFAFYAVFGVQIAAGAFFDYFNLAFDMDPRRYAELIAQESDLRHPRSLPGGPKHPLLHLLQGIGAPLRWLTGDWKLSAALTSCLMGALSVGFCFLFFRWLSVGAALSAAAAGLFGVSAAPFLNAFLSDSYVYALTTITLAWAICALRLRSPGQARSLNIAAGVLSFGVTVTNVFQNILGEAVVRKRSHSWRTLFITLFQYGVLVGIAALIVLILVFPDKMLWIATHPIDALKIVYWQQTKGETTGLKQVLISFFLYGFVAPEFTTVSLPSGAPMLDFRSWRFGPLGLAAIVGWVVLLCVSAFCAARDRSERKWLYLGLLIAILVNLFLHGRYQFRGSVYLYAPHILFNIFGFVAASLIAAQNMSKRGQTAVLAGLIGLTALTAAVNIPRSMELSTQFDSFVAKPEWSEDLETRAGVNAGAVAQ